MFLKNTILILLSYTILLSLISLTKQSAHCNELAENNGCDFYEKCIESNSFCGPNGFAMDYGTLNCLRYTKNIESFSPEGQTYVKESLKCLKKVLIPYEEEKDCNTIMNAGYKYESQCYFESGLSNILKDSENVHAFVKSLLTINQIKNLKDISPIRAILDAADNCEREDYERFIQMIYIYTN